ncbi:endonuclease/exonuclease/phosphatase family protein [Lentimicrobium sp.]|uniref:endonuclease/exonuclease/phosphatase family protein n=1 Tax=Lentimicrobium sp. TaxID=2034841 RepID=UPI002C0C3537|nr:endonuclease/exonuclease/phosphatase family protein [Lentimicrobium sp.]HPF64300.1 endonuclease/exonuclease/phosphatase family protein [Lentimicrobium sp.]HRW68533.1 endonuclease/exonuclease/phosphatase family protein [Lentimicrobium sp.]
MNLQPRRVSLVLGILISGLLFVIQACAQDKKFLATTIAFYNVENLFDTIDDPNTNDAEFLPAGINRWTSQRYQAKLSNMARVIAGIGSELVAGGPAIIGLSEIENRLVMEDLIKTPPLKELGYEIVHFDSPDRRGIDVGLLYKPSVFKVINATSNRLFMPGHPGFFSRDQLVVTGELHGDLISVIVNHWPSRRSGPEYREEAARLSRQLADSLMKEHRHAKIFVMGDLNDDPTDRSVAKVLGAKGKAEDVRKGDLFNPMYQLFRDGIGSLAYRDAWNLFDQIIISEAVLNANKGWKFYKAKIYNEKFLIQKDGPYAGYPFRTFAGGAYAGGYSDHFPAYLFLIKEK